MARGLGISARGLKFGLFLPAMLYWGSKLATPSVESSARKA